MPKIIIIEKIQKYRKCPALRVLHCKDSNIVSDILAQELLNIFIRPYMACFDMYIVYSKPNDKNVARKC